MLIVETTHKENKAMITKAFQVGQTYTVKDNVTVTIARRTDKSVWFLGWDGKEVRRKVETDTFLKTEFVRYDERNVANACDVVVNKTEVTEVIEVKETVKTESNEPNTTESSAKTITSTERRARIDQFNHYATLLHQTNEDSPKWDAIWDDMQAIKAEIDNATVVD